MLSGCVTAPPTYKTTTDAGARVGAARRIAIAQPDVAVYETSAGGVVEKRDEWSAAARLALARAVAAQTGFEPPPSTLADSAALEELTDAQALVRTIVQNHLIYLFAPDPLSSAHRPLTYQVGRIYRIADAYDADALLFIFASDSRSTGGRKALEFLGFAMPSSTFASAVLVERDGTVLWFNYHFAEPIDLRESGGASTIAGRLLAGLPGR